MDVYGLIGNPVAHSVSPGLHETAYEVRGLDARYVTLETDPERLDQAIEGAAALGIDGLNVTIPFKEAVMEVVDPSETAASIGAVNMIDFSTDPPTGDNTDAAGARRALERHGVDPGAGTAVIVGAGGAARAIGHMLVSAGATVHIANRTASRAESLASDLGGTGHSLDVVPELAAGSDLLINATSVGMEEDRSPVSASVFHEDLAVMDAVYTPLETRFLQDGSAAGATTIDGAWMLLYQGVAAFERWTGVEAPVSAMNEALRNRLESEWSES
ncbi:shikimate dehydrogenase [Halodesulfurarchaeum sp.]|uniref:shikimate dehydrogenase n=1 Tax=Halodesulfurarchaeum sp. TaxID=1980530 RepID=UPI002FC2FEEA